jgi:hypothetical protein
VGSSDCEQNAVLDDLDTSGPKGSVVVYHFFEAGNSEDSFQCLLRHLTSQGISQHGDTVPEAAEVYKTHTRKNIEPLPRDLVQILSTISKASSAMYVVLDGLDECQYLPKLARHLSTLTLAGVKILATSRDLSEVGKCVEGYSKVSVRPGDDEILSYVDWRLREEGEVEYGLFEDGLKKSIAEKLSGHSDGS